MPYIGRNHTSGDHVNNFKVLDDISSYTATFDGTATSVVNTTNNTIRVPEHRFIQGQRVIYTNGGGGNIGGLTSGTAYFIIVDTANTFKLATSASNASISTAINLSSVGTGTSHTINASFDGVNTRFKITHGDGVRGDINNATQLNIAVNNVVQRPNINSASFTEGFSVEDQHKLVFKTAPTSNDIFWGSIIANNLSTFDVSDHKIDTFTGDGSTTEFNLSHTPANNESLMVTINGVLQHPSNATTSRAYSLIASVLQFTAAPANGDEIQARHLGFAGATTSDVTGFYGRTGNVVLGSSDNITVGNINVGTGVTIESNGQATFVGVVTFGSGSTTIDNNVVNVGTALTLGHIQGIQFHTQNLHSAGFDVNQINTSGIITASSLDISGNASIGGVLTYEDVTSIDSVGIITARAGVKVTGGILNVTNSENTLGILSSTDDGANFDLYDNDTQSRIRTVDGQLQLRADVGNAVADSSIRFFVDGANEKVRITSGGNVGIGVTNPSEILTLANPGVGNVVSLRIVDPTATSYGAHFSFYDSPNEVRIGGVSNTTKRAVIRINRDSPSDVFVIDSTGQVGINETSPTRALSIDGDINLASGSKIESYSSGGNLQIQGGSTFPGGHIKMYGGSGDDMITFNTSGSGTSSIERLRINSVGITSVQGQDDQDNFIVNVSGTEFAVHTDASDGEISLRAQDGSANNNAKYMTFFTQKTGQAADEKLRIDSNGRVLIGHTTNQTDLHGPQSTTNRNPFVQLQGANAASAGAALISWSNNAGAYYAPSLFLAHSGSNTIGTNGILPANGEFGSIVFSGDDGTDFVKGAMIKARLDGTPGNDDMPGRLEFYTTPDGAQVPVERLRITKDGKIGINVNSPSSPLHVFNPTTLGSTAGDEQEITKFQGAVSNAGILKFSNLRLSNGSDWTTSTFRIQRVIDVTKMGHIDFGTGGAQSGRDIQFGNGGGTVYMHLDNSARVGIGSENPEKHLTIRRTGGSDGGILVLPNAPYSSNVDRAYLIVGANNWNGSTSNWGTFGFHHRIKSDAGGTPRITIDNASGELFTVNNAGKVGISSSHPNMPLDVFATGTTIAQFGDSRTNSFECIRIKNNVAGYPAISNDSSPDTLELRSAGSVQASIDSNNNSTGKYFRVVTNGQGSAGTELIRVQDNGTVGIGTISPNHQLHVVQKTTDSYGTGVARFEYYDTDDNGGDQHYDARFIPTGTYIKSFITGSGTDFLIVDADNSAGRASFAVEAAGGTERFRVDSTGNVGINSAIPSAKLDVRGDINFQNNALITSNGGTGNVDHIWHSDASNYGRGGTWNFVSDGAYKGAGQSTIQIGYLANAGGGHFLNNVGIGITTVARGPLHVHENSSNDCQIHLTNNDTGSTSSDGLTIFTDTDTSGIWSRENVDFQIATNGIERMRIKNDGRVDIGGTNEIQLTSSSNYMLYLHGAIVGANLDFCYGQRILLDDDDTGTTTADRERGCLYLDFNGNASGGNTTDETRLWNIYSDVDVTADYDLVYGLYSDIKTTHTSGTISEMRGVYALVQSANSGDVTNMTGLYGLAQTTTGANTDTVGDIIGVRGRVNMSAGTSTANAVDVIGIWGNIDNDNNTAQATGGKCALFYGSYDKTTGLHNPQGIRIDTDVPNYFRGGLALGNGGNFLPVDNHKIHIQDQANATGILLRQTGNYYNSIIGDANRTGAGNAILDLRGRWNGTDVARIRFETGTDTSNKDDGQIQFFTASAGTISERMHIQPNGEIAVKSNGTPGDAIANLHVQNGTFRVSQSAGPTTEYLQVTAHTHNTDGDRHAMRYVSGGTNYMSLSKNGQLGTLHHHYAGRTRSDANAPTNYYSHGSFGFHAYAGRTDDTTNYRTLALMRAWEGGDTEDRNFMYYVDSTSDTTSVDYDQHQRFGIKASGMLQAREDGWFGRCESDEASPNSVYTANNTNLMRVYATNSQALVYCQAVAAPTNSIYSFYVETGTSTADDDIQFRIRSTDGAITSDSGSIGSPGDYAECFEWLDGNPSNEDRVGISVVLIGDKIRPATSSDDPSKIIGIVSANPIVVGDAAPLKYHDRYLKDDWGRDIMEDVEMLVWNIGQFEYQPKQTDTFALQKCDECIPVSDIDAALAEGRIKQWVVDQNLRRMDQRKKVNPNFDVTKKDTYKPRLERPEWDAIGMVGKVFMRKGQPTGTNWIKLSDKTASIERWLVR